MAAKSGIVAALSLLTLLSAGCQSKSSFRREADQAATRIIAEKQEEALGRSAPFTIERPSETLRQRLLRGQDLPQAAPPSPAEAPPDRETRAQEKEPVPWLGEDPLVLNLLQALQVGARNSREYQTRKEEVFRVALALDLEREEFRSSFTGLLKGFLSSDGAGGETVSGAGTSVESSFTRRLRSGAELTGRFAVDLVKLLTQGRSSSLGFFADATVSLPLLRGAGEQVVTEPLVQAERDVLYALWDFERFKRGFAVQVAAGYLGVLRARQEVENARENYRGLISATRRAQRLAEAGRLPGFQYDQALQNELRARRGWIAAGESFASVLDRFKTLIGLPTDARIDLDSAEIDRLVPPENSARPGPERLPGEDEPIVLSPPGQGTKGPLEMDGNRAVSLALDNRLDLRIALGRVIDARRKVDVAADALRGEVTLLGSANLGERRNVGSADRENAAVSFDQGRYSALLTVDLPFDRVAERNAFRDSYILLERAMRGLDELEDQVKLDVRNRLRRLRESREGIRIQARAVHIAERRVKSTDLFLQAGRAEIRDLLESREALLTTLNALTAALVDYRVAELELQRDMGLLQVDEKGLWREYRTDDNS